MSIDGSDDEAPTKVDVDLSGSSSAEITIKVGPDAGRDALPADSEPTTLEPQMTVHGLGLAPEHPADQEGPTKSVEVRLLKAYAAEVQGAEERRAARQGGKPRAPSLPTIITPSEPYRTLSPTAKAAAPAAVEDAEVETVTDTRTAVLEDPLLAPIESGDAVTTVSDAPRMLSSSELITDPGITDSGIPVLAAVEDEDEPYGSGTVKIIVTPAAMPVEASLAILMPAPVPEALAIPPTSAVAPASPSAPTEIARRVRHRNGGARRAITFVVSLAALAALAAAAVFAIVGPRSMLSREKAPAPAFVSASSSTVATASARSAESHEVAPASSAESHEVAPASSAESHEVAPASSAIEKPRSPAPYRIPRPAVKPAAKPTAPPPSSSAQKAWAPLHI